MGNSASNQQDPKEKEERPVIWEETKGQAKDKDGALHKHARTSRKRPSVRLYFQTSDEVVEALRNNVEIKLQVAPNYKIKDLAAIADALKNNTSVKKLYLYKNGLRDIACLAEALKTNQTLEVLSLGGNRIKNLSPLAEALAVNRTLKSLYLYGNRISNFSSLGLALKLNTTLTVLRLNNNPFLAPADVYQSLTRRQADILGSCETLAHLHKLRRDHQAWTIVTSMRPATESTLPENGQPLQEKGMFLQLDHSAKSIIASFLWHSVGVKDQLRRTIQLTFGQEETDQSRIVLRWLIEEQSAMEKTQKSSKASRLVLAKIYSSMDSSVDSMPDRAIRSKSDSSRFSFSSVESILSESISNVSIPGIIRSRRQSSLDSITMSITSSYGIRGIC